MGRKVTKGFEREFKKCMQCTWRNEMMCYHPFYARLTQDLYGDPAIEPVPIESVGHDCRFSEPIKGRPKWFLWVSLPFDIRVRAVKSRAK